MSMSIKTNVASLEAQKNLMSSESSLNSSLAKLSSGFRITKASDDAAGLAIAVNLGAQIRSYNQAVRDHAAARQGTPPAELTPIRAPKINIPRPPPRDSPAARPRPRGLACPPPSVSARF